LRLSAFLNDEVMIATRANDEAKSLPRKPTIQAVYVSAGSRLVETEVPAVNQHVALELAEGIVLAMSITDYDYPHRHLPLRAWLGTG
jgi:hypothetical protein